MSRLTSAVEPVTRNPLRVLGLTPAATQRDVEREGGRILALIAAGLDTPSVPRTAEDVRAAMAELRDPSRRAMHELLALSAEAPPVDQERLREHLERVKVDPTQVQPLHSVLRQMAGTLVPEPAPFTPDAELAQALARSLEPAPPSLPPACVDELGLEFP